MSARQCRLVVKAALADPIEGLEAKAQTRFEAEDLDTHRRDYRFGAMALDGRMTPTTRPNVSVAELGWDADLKANFGARDGLVPLQVTYELVDADEEILADNAAINAEAMLQVLDFLREYSDAHGGTIIQVLDRASIRFGYFGEDVPSYGFRCTFTVQERSTI